jgi:hypothetical protein
MGLLQVKPEGEKGELTVYKRKEIPRADTIGAWSHQAKEKQTWLLWTRTMASRKVYEQWTRSYTRVCLILILIPTSLRVLKLGYQALDVPSDFLHHIKR